MARIICFLKTIWRSITTLQIFNGVIVDGHNYREIYDNKDLQILECQLCGHISLGFKGGE